MLYTGTVPMEDSMEALLRELVEPLLPPTRRNPMPRPSISQQEAVAKQMHAVVLLYNYYHRKQCPQIDFLPFESLCKSAVVSDEPLLAYLNKTVSASEDLSLVEKSIMRACNISSALFDHDTRTIETWPVERVAVFLADAKREKCFLESDTLVKGVFSLVEREAEGQLAEDVLQELAVSEVESRTGISRTSLRTLYSRQTYSLNEEKSRAVIFLMECSKPLVDDMGFAPVPIKDVLDNLKGPVFTGGSSPDLTRVSAFFLLLPYADIISDWLSKPTSELEKELEKKQEKPTNSNHKSPMKIENQKHPSNGSPKEKGKNGNDSPVNKRKHATCIAVPSNNSSVKHETSFVEPSNKSSLENVTSIAELSNNASLKPVSLGKESCNNNRENGTIKEITNNVTRRIGEASKELAEINSNPCTSTKWPIIGISVKQETVPFVEKDLASCLQFLSKGRDYAFEKQRLLEDEIALREMDIMTVICEGKVTPKVEKIIERWANPNSSEVQLGSSGGSLNPNRKRFKFRSSCQQLDDNCRDNNLPLPRYSVHPSISNGLYTASATLKGMDIDCTADSDLKKTPREAREQAALHLMEKLCEMEND